MQQKSLRNSNFKIMEILRFCKFIRFFLSSGSNLIIRLKYVLLSNLINYRGDIEFCKFQKTVLFLQMLKSGKDMSKIREIGFIALRHGSGDGGRVPRVTHKYDMLRIRAFQEQTCHTIKNEYTIPNSN